MSDIRYRGYLKANNYKEYFELSKNGDYLFNVFADHMYIRTKKIDTYLKDGTFYKTIEEEEFFNKQGIEQIDKQLNVVQIDYNFYLMPTGYVSTIEELESHRTILNNSFKKKFYINHITDPNDSDNLYKSIKKPYEINNYGHTRQIESLCMNFILNIDMNKYKERKDKFIETLNDDYLKHQCEYLFKLNVSNLRAYFMCSEKTLFSKDFDLFNHTLSRLNYNINQKQKLRL